MISLEKIQHEIQELLEHGCMTSQCIKDLTMLYWLEDKMQGREYQQKWAATETPMSREKAQKWTRHMKNADGSSGEHWTYEQTEQVRKREAAEGDPAEFYATMNMLWSDYGEVARKFGVDKPEFWAELSEAFLVDEDAAPEKLERYYRYVVGK